MYTCVLYHVMAGWPHMGSGGCLLLFLHGAITQPCDVRPGGWVLGGGCHENEMDDERKKGKMNGYGKNT